MLIHRKIAESTGRDLKIDIGHFAVFVNLLDDNAAEGFPALFLLVEFHHLRNEFQKIQWG